MPGLIRKVTVIAALDGLILQPPHHSKNQKAVHIEYKTSKISSKQSEPVQDEFSLDSHGIVGLLILPSLAYIVAITGRKQVANIRGYPVFAINDVALIPCSSKVEASTAIAEANASIKPVQDVNSDSELSEDDHATENEPHDDASVKSESIHGDQAAPPNQTRDSNVAQDVIGNQGRYGRFAERWFSKKGWVAERRMVQGMSSNEGTRSKEEEGIFLVPDAATKSNEDHGASPAFKGQNLSFLPKFLRTTRMLFSSGNFFFSYDVDISRRSGTVETAKCSESPLYSSFDSMFFWNRNLTQPFIDRDHHAYVLPIMQGFVGQREFILSNEARKGQEMIPTGAMLDKVHTESPIEDHADDDQHRFLLTLVSRRSVERPGLRYLRRGIDDAGNTANFVETEQILSRKGWPSSQKIYSFSQIRGSIPLFFSQSPYSFKPVPTLQHSHETNLSAFQRHFDKLVDRYGNVQIVLLTDRGGPEGAIGEKYEAFAHLINKGGGIKGRQLGFEWFDFHQKCSGMRFDNVKLLVDDIKEPLESFGYSLETSATLSAYQTGIIRTNCMDCLDRTNVVQSGFAQRILEQGLRNEGLDVDLRNDISTQWFNSLWADNGDAISKQYSSTAALKSDYTRTRKRTYRGAVTDLSLTLSRYYNNIVNDYFSQTVIDFLLGYVNSRIFEDFEENLMSRDPAMSVKKVRENAISTSAKIVIADEGEELVAGWALLSPREPNSIRLLPLEECVLLLTDAALYKVYFEWSIEKVSSFERVDLKSISSIIKGTYVTSTLTSAQTDEDRNGENNVGFIVQYRPGKRNITRVNTRSLSTAPGLNDDASGAWDESTSESEAKPPTKQDAAERSKFLAFKAPATRSSTINDEDEGDKVNERQFVETICQQVGRVAKVGSGQSKALFEVEEASIVSAKEARDSTGLIEHWTYSLKRLVWG